MTGNHTVRTTMVGRLLLLVTLLAPMTSATAAGEGAAADIGLQDLRWLAGSWSGRQGDIDMEEYWLPPRGRMMLGLHRDTAEGRAFFEYLRIEATDEGIFLFASPLGRAATPFKLVETGSRRAVFSNPDHDFPQTIIYKLDDQHRLNVRIEGEEDGESQAREWIWEKGSSSLTEPKE